MDINNLISQFFGGQTDSQPSQQPEQNTGTSNSWTDTAKNIAQQATQGGLGGYAGGAITGGLLTLLLTNKKARNIAGGAIGYGGAAVLGAMALKAYQNYQAGNKTPDASMQSNATSSAQKHMAPELSGPGNTFGVILIKTMVMASKADGHIDATEQQRIFSALEKSTLSSEEKGIILDTLSQPIDLREITANSFTPEQAGEIYLASRIIIDPDQPAEKEFLKNLATGLKLPSDLVTQLEQQVSQYSSPVENSIER